MTIWSPTLDLDDARPLYLAIADAIERDVASGVLAAGARLPTHRRLADSLGVTVGTVSRGYGEAERRGLTVGEVGRGTFVREGGGDGGWASGGASGDIDLSLSVPLETTEERVALTRTLRVLAAEGQGMASRLLRYQPETALRRHREVGAGWIRRTGLEADPDRVIVTAGVQHALTVAFSNLLRPGDVLLTASSTYPGAKALGQSLGLSLRSVSMDEEGIVPDALEAACRVAPRASALYLVPTIQNPTCGVLGETRRRAVAEVAEAHDLLIFEDDVHAFLPPEPPLPVAALAPGRTVYMSSVGKALSLGLRTGFVLAPTHLVDRLVSGVRSTLWMPPPLMVEVACRWIEEGTADGILAAKRAEVRVRHGLLDEVLGDRQIDRHPFGIHAWLHLPEPWRSDELVAQARQRGVLVAGADAFAVGRGESPHAVRISLTSADREDTRRALETLAELLESGVEGCVSVL